MMIFDAWIVTQSSLPCRKLAPARQAAVAAPAIDDALHVLRGGQGTRMRAYHAPTETSQLANASLTSLGLVLSTLG